MAPPPRNWIDACLGPAIAVALLLAAPGPAAAQDLPGAGEPGEMVSPNQDVAGFSPSAPPPSLELSGYLDVGFADAEGDGTSFHPADRRLPADYAADAFAPAVNSRGDVASTEAGGRLTNGFLPRSAGIGGQPSFLLNTASLDLRHGQPTGALLLFARLQLLPRLDDRGSAVRVVLEQAFGRLAPLPSQELFLFAGKFESVFGIEYLEKEAPLRVGVTPSLFARYTSGSYLGAKLFYRYQLPSAWSALSLNVAATNSAPFSEVLLPGEVSLTGRPVFTGRLGYELNLPTFQARLGLNLLRGPRNDQGDREARQRAGALDVRVTFSGLSLSGELIDLEQDPGPAVDKLTGAGRQLIASAFAARGYWAQLAYVVPYSGELLRRVTGHVRAEQRRARFPGFSPVEVRRLTAGLRLDLGDSVILKGEVLLNRELAGAPDVDNDVRTLSLIWTF
jgi:hypothetical protein